MTVRQSTVPCLAIGGMTLFSEFFNYFRTYPSNGTLFYKTKLPIETCIRNIVAGYPILENDDSLEYLSEIPYRCTVVSAQQLHIVFTVGVTRKSKRTEYSVCFQKDEDGVTISMQFLHELLGLPAMISVQDIDTFMQQKCEAHRTEVRQTND